MQRGRTCGGALLVAALMVAVPVGAQTPDRVSLQGFGGWAYATTNNDNTWAYAATNEGNWDNYDFGLNVAAHPVDKVAVRGQVFWGENLQGQEIDVDYVFAEWTKSPAFKVRGGKVLAPFGLYSEIYDIGTLRPFVYLPQIYQGRLGLVPKSYLGAGITGVHAIGSEWEVDYDLFGGEMIFEPFQTPRISGVDPETGLPTFESEELQLSGRQMIGGRLLVASPMRGLDFGGTVIYTGDVKVRLPGGERVAYYASDDATLVNARVQYQRGPFAARGEWFGVLARDANVKSWYVEASYKITRHLQAALQYERMDLDLLPGEDSVPPPLQYSRSYGAALNWWLGPDVVVKVNGYHLDGNLVARPDLAVVDYLQGTLDESTNVFVAGLQFSF
jgi:hypothetical protein